MATTSYDERVSTSQEEIQEPTLANQIRYDLTTRHPNVLPIDVELADDEEVSAECKVGDLNDATIYDRGWTKLIGIQLPSSLDILNSVGRITVEPDPYNEEFVYFMQLSVPIRIVSTDRTAEYFIYSLTIPVSKTYKLLARMTPEGFIYQKAN
ncbi:MAG TPA: hypothetical protein VHA74_00600 [Candidatus Dojkabacteria bacterium]|nr:hypothetical protein [Candidatus Dojkabacteria bacterium]